MKRPVSALALLTLVAVCAAASDRPHPAPEGAAPFGRVPDGVVPYAPRPNHAYRLVPTPDMPEWARGLYRDDITPNVRTLDREFSLWLAAESLERAAADDRAAAEYVENSWEEYYRRWRAAVEPFVQPDGSIDYARGAAPQALSEAGRTSPPATQGTTWELVGPTSTVIQFDANATPPQPLASLQSNIYCFDVAASNPSILYAGSETGVVSKTVDKGLNWTPVGLYNPNFRTSIGAIAVHPTDPDIVYVCNGAGVNLSTDGGATWSLVLADAALAPNDIKIRPDAPNQLLVAGSRLMRRTPGFTWIEVLPRTTYDLEFKPGNATVAYALVQNGNKSEFLKSTDGGQSFTVRSTGWLTGLDDSGGRLTVTPADTARIYAVVLTEDGPRILRSNDSGESWSVVASNPVGSGRVECSVVPSPLAMSNGQGYYDVSIAASATNADHLIVGTLWSYRSVDAGANYTIMELCTGMQVHADVQEMKNVGGDSWIATDGGMNLSTDFWASPENFSSRTNGLMGTQCWGFGQGWNEDALVSGRYHNASGAWHEGFPPGQFLGYGSGEPITGYINPANSRMVYDLYSGGLILPTSINGTITSFPVALFPSETTNRGGGFPSMDNGEQEWDPRFAGSYYIGRTDGLWVTHDNGTTFANLWAGPGDPLAEVQHIEVSRTNPNVLYVTVWRPTAGELWKSTDGGASFTPCANPGGLTDLERQVSTITLSGTDPDVLWWCFRNAPDGQKVFKSTDGGQSWINLTTPALNGIRLADMVHQLGTDGGVYLAGDFGAVFYRNNSMPDWVTWNAGLPAQLVEEMCRLGIQYKYGKLRMASRVGFWQVDLYENSTSTLVQPMVSRRDACPEDVLQFESYSVVNGPASYHWSFSPPAQWISDPDARNPQVVLGWPAAHYAVTLTVTDDNGVTQRTINNGTGLPTPIWASSVVDFSSQYSTTDWSAAAALGPPNVYPAYGDLGNAWASATEDGQPEFLHVAFPAPRRVNFVQVVETFNPGALVRVSVKNPNTNQLEPVWAGPASPGDPLARVLTISFTEPPFLVGEIRLDFDSPAVPGWNEVDAIGIGLSECPSTYVSAVPPAAGPPPATLLRSASPNPFSRSVRIAYSLAGTGPVRIDIFNVGGQRVVRLLDAVQAAAEHEITWDGRDAGGRPVAGGIYYVRLEADGERASRKLIKLQ